MRLRIPFVLMFCLLACGGCKKTKSTDELIQDLKSPQEKERIIAVRLLPERKADAAKVIPALIEALKGKDREVRLSAAIGLGYFGEEAKDAIPALQEAEHDRDIRVRGAASKALSRIDPKQFPPPSQSGGAPGK
ncbi:MAG TPA: HEAT repeat domain-containing protein [Gemmataceae bacterium]|nr:HEAT repeat domain-containing protein [Gemmataceae bacterium]